MLKKTAVISAAVLAVCLIAFFALSPLAVSDAVKLAQQAAPSYAVLTELSAYTAENIQAVTLTGSLAEALEVRPSSDNKIHVLTDHYSVAPPVFKARPSGDGTLELYGVFESPSPITLLTRENVQRLIVAHLNNAPLNRIILELPANVAFKRGVYGDQYYYDYYNLSIDERVTVLEPQEVPISEEEKVPENGSDTALTDESASSEVSPVL